MDLTRLLEEANRRRILPSKHFDSEERRIIDELKKIQNITDTSENKKEKLKSQKIGELRKLDELRKRNQQLANYVNLLNKSASLNLPEISKNSFWIGSDFYSLWGDNSPICKKDCSKILYLHSSRKNQPLEIREAGSKSISNYNTLKEFNLIHDKFYYTGSGLILADRNFEISDAIFDKVLKGVKILPEKCLGNLLYTENGFFKSEANPEIERKWGQQYLESLSPSNIIQGNLLGSGGAYLAYEFGDLMIVEFDKEKRATYLFNRDQFNELKDYGRRELREDKPLGFEGIIIHKGSQENWKDSISDFLKKK